MSVTSTGARRTIPVYVGTSPTISDTILNAATGQAVDLTGSTVTLVVQDPAGVQTSYAATIGNQVTNKGSVSITCPGPVAAAQTYWLAWWHVVQGPTILDTSTFAISILAHGVEAPVLVGPASSWITGADVIAFCPTTNAALADQAAAWATDVLYAVTARQFRGIAFDTIRPARTGCQCWGLAGVALPLTWGNWAGYFGWGHWDLPIPQGCGALSEIKLAYPVSQVLQVKVDGSVLPASSYRVDEERMLVRLADPDGTQQRWPSCQDLRLPDTAAGTWSVEYTWGQSPPQLALDAAKELACQLSQAASGGACALPTGTTRVSRAGITIDRGILANWAKDGSTGLPLVDAAIRAYNPNGLTMRPAVFSPDVPRYGRHVGF